MAKKKSASTDEPATAAAAPPRRRATKQRSADPPPAAEPTYDQIAEAAYQRYLQRGGHHGQDFDDWVEAERALKERRR